MMKKFSLLVAAVAIVLFSFNRMTPPHLLHTDVLKNTRISSLNLNDVTLKYVHMTSNQVMRIDTNKVVDYMKTTSEKQARFFISTKENPAYVMAKNFNVLARSWIGAMVPYSGAIQAVHETILCPDVGVGVGYKISSHITLNAAYDGAFLTMADDKRYDKNINTVGIGLTILF